MATITEILNGITGLSFRTAINNNFTNLNNDKAETTHNHDTVYAAIAYEATVDGHITTLADHETRVTDLEAFHTYDYSSISNTTVTNDVYETLIDYTTPTRDAGTYELRMSQLYTLNSTTTSAYFRFSLDGGTTWTEVRKESKDVTDIIPDTYWKVITHTSGTINIIIQARKEVASDVLTIHEMTVAIARKL